MAQTNYRWNFTVNAMDISFYTLALNMVSQTTILPLLVAQLTNSKLAIGLVPAVFSLGFFLPQLLTASYTERLRLKKPFLMLWGALGERSPYLWIGLIILLLGKTHPILTLIGLYLGVLIATGSAGMLTPAWYDLIAKVIPINRRGLWSGVGNGTGAFLGIAGAAAAGYFLTNWPFPTNYALCFLTASVFFYLSLGSLALNREPESETVKPHISLLSYLQQLPAVLRRDRNYQIFLVSRSMANLGGMASGFFIVYASERFGMNGAEVGTLTGVLVGSQALMNLLWGVTGDRKGHKLVLTASSFALALASLSALLVPTGALFWVVFFLLGISLAGDAVSGFNIILEFCAPEDRPTYIGLTNTLLAPVKALAPIIGGWLATWLGYRPMFSIALAIAVLGGGMLAIWLREPRDQMRS